MCGICGVVMDRGVVERDRLQRMTDTMVHRGPDEEGVWLSPDRRVGFGHRRLRIIDLSPTGSQPMAGRNDALWVTFNGEIYNHAELRDELRSRGHEFRGSSDTEVILAAYEEWGEECLKRFNGMFALALLDRDRGVVLLARDRAGEKPLFYAETAAGLVFASELKALLADPRVGRALDLDALNAYLAFGYVPGEQCILAGVRKLPAGTAMRFRLDGGGATRWSYWELPDYGGAGASADELADELEVLLEDSVRLRLRADVPVGILLSGGLDSSLITAIAAKVSPGRIRTFTATFPGEGRFDEAHHAREVATFFGTAHEELPLEPATVDILPRLAAQYDEPLADSSMVPTYLLSRLIRRHATVALGGDGGDELFGGYKRYRWILALARARSVLPGPARRMIGGVGLALPAGVRGRNYMIGLGKGAAESIAHANMLFEASTRRSLLGPVWERVGASLDGPEAYKAGLCNGATPLQNATRVDFLTYLPDDILVKVDRASMLASLEVRAPWLDHRIIELAFARTPDRLRTVREQGKVLPRLLADRLLPGSLDTARKQGFSLPLASWFRGEWGSFVRQVLSDPASDLFDARVVNRLLAGQARGHANTHRLFALTMFELWRREYGIAADVVAS